LHIKGVIESMRDLDCLSVVMKSSADTIEKLPVNDFADSLMLLMIGLPRHSVLESRATLSDPIATDPEPRLWPGSGRVAE
jgi:hypothetical protein